MCGIILYDNIMYGINMYAINMYEAEASKSGGRSTFLITLL